MNQTRLCCFLLIFLTSTTVLAQSSSDHSTKEEERAVKYETSLSCTSKGESIQQIAIGSYQIPLDIYKKLRENDIVDREKRDAEENKLTEAIKQGELTTDAYSTFFDEPPRPGTTDFIRSSLKNWFNQKSMSKFKADLDLKCDNEGYLIGDQGNKITINDHVYTIIYDLYACCRSEAVKHRSVHYQFKAYPEAEAKSPKELGLKIVQDIKFKTQMRTKRKTIWTSIMDWLAF